jgi:surfactin synthase thioesterase subunit
VTSPWLPRLERTPAPVDPRITVVCLPSAAGSAQLFRPWRSVLPEEVAIRPVELPGHGRRLVETPVSDVDEVVAGAVDAVLEEVPDPIVLFGHSFGALLAFELARALEARQRPVGRLVVAAFPAPSRLGRRIDPTSASDEDLSGYLPDEARVVLAHHELRAAVLATLRADLTAIARYDWRPGQPLVSPITAMAGTSDDVPIDDVAAWGDHTTAPFSLHRVEGDHFFPLRRANGFLALLADELGVHGEAR